MYYISDELMKKLDPEVQKLIIAEGELKEPEVGIEAEKPADQKTSDIADLINLEDKLPKKLTYGEEGEYEDEVMPNGKMTELPESKKNKIEDFQEAGVRGMALLKGLDKPKKPKDLVQNKEDETDLL